eukprot:1039765-Amphidinium_carterae.1
MIALLSLLFGRATKCKILWNHRDAVTISCPSCSGNTSRPHNSSVGYERPACSKRSEGSPVLAVSSARTQREALKEKASHFLCITFFVLGLVYWPPPTDSSGSKQTLSLPNFENGNVPRAGNLLMPLDQESQKSG